MAQVGPTWALLGLSWPTWAHFGLFLGPSWAYLGSLLGLSWAILGLAWALFAYLGSLLGLSWPIFGRSWALLGPLGPSWASLGHLFNMSSILLQCPTTFNFLSQAPSRTRFPFHAKTGFSFPSPRVEPVGMALPPFVCTRKASNKVDAPPIHDDLRQSGWAHRP